MRNRRKLFLRKLVVFRLADVTPEELDQQAETLELINSEVADRLARQSDSNVRIETKATTLVGFAVAAASFLATQHPQPVLAALAYAAYAAAAGLAALAFAVGSYREVPEPRALLNGYARRSRAQTLAALAAERVGPSRRTQRSIGARRCGGGSASRPC
jgi:hypothetical protein